MPEPIEVRKVPIKSVADASGLAQLIDDGVMQADRVIAIIGKTEGNGGVNDYTRIIADRAFREVLIDKGAPEEQVKQVPIVWSGGTDGVISPHATIFATTDAEPTEEPRLTVGFAMSAELKPEDIGRPAMVEKVADAVKAAMRDAGIDDPREVHYVQTKTPLLTIDSVRDAESRGKHVACEVHDSMGVSNGTTALGIAVALGEIEMPRAEDICRNLELYSAVASCSSGVELTQAQIVLLGNKPGAGGRYRIGHAARPIFAARHFAVIRPDENRPVGLKCFQVSLRGGMIPHPHVHGGGHQHALVGGEQRGGGQIVGVAGCQFRHQVGGCGRHHHNVRRTRQLYMPHLGFIGEAEQVLENPLTSQRRNGEGRHEFRARTGEDGAHPGAAFAQAADQFKALVGGDAAADDEQDAIAAHKRTPWLSGHYTGAKGKLHQITMAKCGSSSGGTSP
jgi:ring-opening amidohydrolase-like protein